MAKAIKKTIFFIEDDAGIIDVYSMAFAAAKIKTEVITHGQEAIEKIKEVEAGKLQKPSLILLDLMLPDISGIDIFKEIKASAVTKDIPVFVTSNYTIEQMPEMKEIQPEKFILKSGITPTNLTALVKEQLEK